MAIFFIIKIFIIHLRKSKTENKIRVSYEGSKKYLKEIKKWLMKI
jgi:phosphomannomutase